MSPVYAKSYDVASRHSALRDGRRKVCIMNKKVLFYLMVIVPFFAQSNENRVLLAGSIQFPANVMQAPSLKVFYQGYKYPVEVFSEAQLGRFELYADAPCDVLYCIITENLQIPDKNNFDHFKTALNFPYRLFKLTKGSFQSESKNDVPKLTWFIEEIPALEKELTLPDNTLIFFMPPSMIVGLVEDPWLENQHVIRLPRIVFQDKITEIELHDTATRMTLALLDFELFHAQLPKRIMITDSRIVAMPYLQRSVRV
jgi:hypothetical protein